MFGPDSRQVGVDGDRSDFNDQPPAWAWADQRGDIPTPPVAPLQEGEGELASQIVFLPAGLPPVLLVSYLNIERRIEGNM